MGTLAHLDQPAALDRGVMRGAEVKARLDAILDIVNHAMKEGLDYGKVPGTDKPSLWQAGADKLCVAFQIAPKIRTTDDIGDGQTKAYRVVVVGVHQSSGLELGEGAGECSSAEEKYAFRYSVHENEWNATPEDRKRLKFKRDGKTIQQILTNPADVANTVLKMAVKRAKIAMVLAVTGAAAIFTQDVEDLAEELRESMGDDGDQRSQEERKQPQRRSETGATKPTSAAAQAKFVVGLIEKVWRPKDKKYFQIKVKGDDRIFTQWIDKGEQLEKDASQFVGTDHAVKLSYTEDVKGDRTYYNAVAVAIADEPVTKAAAEPLTASDIPFGDREPGSEG